MVTRRYHLHRLLVESDVTVSPTYGNQTNSSYNGDPNFDSNMVIILAALLCALLCALGINSIVRCALRCTRQLGGETADQVAVRLASNNLKKEALSQIPVVVYKSELQIPATDCPICLGEFVEGEDVRILPRCNHGFHVKCIDRWLVSHSSCPTCRQPLIEQSTNANTEHVGVEIA